MICQCCRRDVDHVRESFWHGDARICRECFARWYDPDNDQIGSTDCVSIGNYVRLRHGLPPLAAALAALLFVFPSASYASRHCLDQPEAARTWPERALAQDDDGCWTYDHRPVRKQLALSIPGEPVEPARDATLGEAWLESEQVLAELHQLEVEQASRAGPPSSQGPQHLRIRHLALFVALVLATVSVLEVATWRPARPRWPRIRKPG